MKNFFFFICCLAVGIHLFVDGENQPMSDVKEKDGAKTEQAALAVSKQTLRTNSVKEASGLKKALEEKKTEIVGLGHVREKQTIN